jgi:hypothetical protein
MASPRFAQAVHGWLTVIWLAATPLVILFLRESVPFLVFISVYAVVTGHWSSWQAARVEVRQELAEEELGISAEVSNAIKGKK